MNGDPNNDVADKVSWDSLPSRTNFFGGDLKGIIQKLDYLQDLQIATVILSPIFVSPSNHKYDTIDYFHIDPSFGTIEDLRTLVRGAHQRNIKVILDGVFNHIGYYSLIFQDVITHGESSQYWDWFYIHGSKVDTEFVNYECVGDYKWMPKLRYSSSSLREYILSIGKYWIEVADIDGWRLDVADEVDFTFWQRFRQEIKKIRSDALLVGETWKDGRDLLRGDEMDTIMNYRFRTNVVSFLGGGSLDVKSFQHQMEEMIFNYPSPVHHHLYNLLSSHDTSRIMTALNNNIKRVKQAIVLLMTYPGMPIIFYGDEMGMEGETDPDCRKTMRWSKARSSIEAFTRRMIDIRNTSLSLQKGSMMHLNIGKNIYCFMRKLDDEWMLIMINPTDIDEQLDIHVSDLCLETLPKSHEASMVVSVRGHESMLIHGSFVKGTINEVRFL
jgi:glycosidase